MECLTLKDVSYRYEGAAEYVLNGCSAAFERGKVYAVTGESGAGKSSLLALIAGLDACTGGDICYEGTNLKHIDRDVYRSRNVGVIFQSYNLLLNSTAVYNVTLSMRISGNNADRKAQKEAAYALLDSVGIDREKAGRKILKLSGGEQQRVGVARALANGAGVIAADEPTGSLDAETEQAVLDIFKRLAREENKCVIIVTHSDSVAAAADVVIGLEAGRFIGAQAQLQTGENDK